MNSAVDWYTSICIGNLLLLLIFFSSEPIMSYFVEHYLEDVTGFNVTKCVHVQANMPDPIEETRYCYAWQSTYQMCSDILLIRSILIR